MNILNTLTFRIVAGLFQGFWRETAGQIFLTTFLAYSASYMLYSGYISWFAGGYGGLLLSQVGFTAIDFLSLVPTSILLLFESIRALFWPTVKYILIYFVSPLILAWLLLTLSIKWSTHIYSKNEILTLVGLGFWILGAYLGLEPFNAKNSHVLTISVTLIVVGTILFSLFLPLKLNSLPTQPPPGASQKPNIGLEIFTFSLLVLISTLPFLTGLRMAEFATKEKLLSRLTRIVLKQPIQIAGLQESQSETTEEPSPKTGCLVAMFKPSNKPKPNIFTYEGNRDLPVYLIASFNRITALYLTPELLKGERGKMVILANDLICSMEVEGRRKSV